MEWGGGEMEGDSGSRRPPAAALRHAPNRGAALCDWLGHCPVLRLRLPQFLHNVAINLREGGFFVGTVPDGKRVNACIKE